MLANHSGVTGIVSRQAVEQALRVALGVSFLHEIVIPLLAEVLMKGFSRLFREHSQADGFHLHPFRDVFCDDVHLEDKIVDF
jgi:hypothetical protein